MCSHLRLQKGQTVADMGTGTGYFLRYLFEAVGEGETVLPLDVEPDRVRYLRPERDVISGSPF